MSTLTLVTPESGDWVKLFLDGKLFEEGHSLNWPYVLEQMIGITIDSVVQYELDDTYYEEEFGEDLIGIPEDKMNFYSETP